MVDEWMMKWKAPGDSQNSADSISFTEKKMADFGMHACCQRKTLNKYSKRSLSWHWHNKTSILGLKGVSVAKAIKGFASEPTGASQNVSPDPPDPKKLSFGFSVKYFFDISAAAKTLFFIPVVCIIVVTKTLASSSWFWIRFHYLDSIFLDNHLPQPQFFALNFDG